MLILDLCGGTGGWSQPYKDAGYDVRLIDINNEQDVRLLEFPGDGVRGVLAAPPCTHLASSGARWWKDKGEKALLEALSVADACLRIVMMCRPIWWALENPVGRLSRYYGPPTMVFNPCDYGDPYTKKTLLWGSFNIPTKTPVQPIMTNYIRDVPSNLDRGRIRSVTPAGFARAFFEANK